MAKELAPQVTVNAILPGIHRTPIYHDDEAIMEAALDMYKFHIWLKRFGTAENVAGVAYFLASGDSNYLTGTSINVTGGMIFP
ncbi:MAG: SDR family oxidoreductase [Promethearchaeota archaeon]